MLGRVIIVDDEEEIVKILAEFLESGGYSVVGKGRTGRDAVELNEALKPDLVVLDVEMPEMDGLEATRLMMQTRPVPIILCTGCHDKRVSEQAVEAGVYAILLKPLRLTDLMAAMAIAISRHRKATDLQDNVDELRQSIENRKWVEKAKGILMRAQGLGEEQAHRYLQIESQRRSQPLAELAKAIVTAEEVLGVGAVGQIAGAVGMQSKRLENT